MLNRVVLPAAALAETHLGDGWHVTLLVDRDPGPLPIQVETLEAKLAHRLSLGLRDVVQTEYALQRAQAGFLPLRAAISRYDGGNMQQMRTTEGISSGGLRLCRLQRRSGPTVGWEHGN
jgi:hypothetical protein